MNKNKKTGAYIFLHVILVLYSVISVLSKAASGYPVLSFGFSACYAGVLFLLFVYAVLWQQVLKILPLTVAYANKAIVIVWGIIWGILFFGEAVKWNMIVGAIIIMAGICLVVSEDGE